MSAETLEAGREPTNEREQLCRIAEQIMGWTVEWYLNRGNKIERGTGYNPHRFSGHYFIGPDGETKGAEVPGKRWEPFTDPAADYTVLEHVRKTWDAAATRRFNMFVYEAWESRGKQYDQSNPWIRYEIGDYSRAALSALEATRQETPK